MHTGSDVTHGPHIRTALPIEHRNWAHMAHCRRGGSGSWLAETCFENCLRQTLRNVCMTGLISAVLLWSDLFCLFPSFEDVLALAGA